MAARVAIWGATSVRALRLATAAAVVLLAARTSSAIEAQDECVNAAPIGSVRFAETVDARTATTGVDDPLQSCSTGGPNRNANSVWYRYVAPATGTLTVATMTMPFPGNPPTIVTVSTGGCANLKEIACADDPLRGDTAVAARVNAASTYWIEIATEPGTSGGLMAVTMALDPDSPICPIGGGTFLKGAVNLVGLGAPYGNERLKITARLVFPEPLPQHAIDGLQLLLDSFVPEYASLAEWSARTVAIPAGGPGKGCDPRDGWTTSKNGASRRYRNHSNALPPACGRGSANGLKEIRLLRKSSDWRIVDLKVRAKDMQLPNPPAFEFGHDALVWLSTTVGATLGPETAGRCANTRPPLVCVRNGTGTAITCKRL
ncbi:MAG: hypothetical protein IT294_09505 [Deltaproteobacteria bacterium]|nr:hypothetical protein [Deltaproteobacteria bacterium]